MGGLGKLPEVQCNQSSDLTWQPKESDFIPWRQWGTTEGSFSGRAVWSDMNSRMLTPAATGSEDSLQGAHGLHASWLESDGNSVLEIMWQ